jgi:hypothetical protein
MERLHGRLLSGRRPEKHLHGFLIAQQTVSEQMAEIFQSTRDGCATDEDVKRLKILREQYIALSKEVEDVMGRRLARKQPNDT